MRVVVGLPPPAALLVEVVVGEGQRQVVGPELHERPELRDGDDPHEEKPHDRAAGQHRAVEDRVRLRRVGHGPHAQEGDLAPLDQPVDEEREAGRHQQQAR